MRLRVSSYIEHRRWVLPMACIVGSFLLATITLAIDRRFDCAHIRPSSVIRRPPPQTLLSTIVHQPLRTGPAPCRT